MNALMNTRMDSKYLDKMTACHDCDLLVERIPLDVDQQAHCPRCNNLMYQERRDTNNKTLIASFSGLLMVMPAYFTPMMNMEALGIGNSASVIQSIPPMLNSSYWIAGLGLMLFAVLVPILILLISFWISLHLRFELYPKYLVTLQKSYQRLISWGMSEVYILGLIVAFVKLLDDFTVTIGAGLICFILLMFCSLLVTTTSSRHHFWETLNANS